jgi:hypothetical protein
MIMFVEMGIEIIDGVQKAIISIRKPKVKNLLSKMLQEAG